MSRRRGGARPSAPALRQIGRSAFGDGQTHGASFESEHRKLVALANEAGDREVLAFAASRGRWLGFTGREIYLVTGESFVEISLRSV